MRHAILKLISSPSVFGPVSGIRVCVQNITIFCGDHFFFRVRHQRTDVSVEEEAASGFAGGGGDASPLFGFAGLDDMLYKIAHVLVYALARLFFRLSVVGVENVPKKGGVIVAANHNSYFDIPLLGCSLARRADNIAKSELFRNRLLAALFTALGGFPVRRGKFDRSAISESVKRLRAGRLLAIYPEGTRSPDGRLQSAMPGIGLLVTKSGAKVVPAYIQGAHPVRIFRRVTVIFGKPLDFKGEIDLAEKEGVIPKILYARIASKIMTNVAQLESELSSPSVG